MLTSVILTDTGNANFSRAVFSGLTISTCHAYVTETIGISSGEIVYDPDLKLYVQDVTLSNTGTTAVAGPLFLILEDLPLVGSRWRTSRRLLPVSHRLAAGSWRRFPLVRRWRRILRRS
jgi:hypothetical protein